jgi:hypothetical protein
MQHGTRGSTAEAGGRWADHILSTLFSWNELYLFHEKLQAEIEFFAKGACFRGTGKLFWPPSAV